MSDSDHDRRLGGHPGISRYAKDLQDGQQLMASRNGPKRDCACWKISPPLLVRDLDAHERSLSFTYRMPEESCSSLGRCISVNEGQAE